MKKRTAKAAAACFICLALLSGCGYGMPAVQSGEESAKEKETEEDISASGNAENKADSEKVTESSTGGENETQTRPLGTVGFTVLSADDAGSFAGKEMTADQEYLQTALSSDVYFCEQPLERIEVHPILEWADDYSSFVFSDEIVGTVDPVEAREPFRILDLYPEGIPCSCLVFYLEDGSCGTFALGYNGSGEEQSWECAFYESPASMMEFLRAETGEKDGTD